MINLSPLKPQFKGKPLAVMGLGKSGLPVIEACTAAGIATVAWDEDEAARNAAREKGAAIENLAEADFLRFAALCLAPGIPLTHPQPHPAVLRAQVAGVEVLGDIELFHRAKPDVRTIGITGTNGKSTTTALIGHILREAGILSAIGGNIGTAILSLPDLAAGSVYVIEMSSYQIDLCPTFAPDIAVLINLAPDHIDRHGDMEGYIAAKERIFRPMLPLSPHAEHGRERVGVRGGRILASESEKKEQALPPPHPNPLPPRPTGAGERGLSGTAIVGLDDAWSATVYGKVANTQRRDIPVSCLHSLYEGVYVSQEGILHDNGRIVCDLKTCPNLKGRHNWQNAGMAYAACITAGAAVDSIVKGLQSFPGLAHRQKIVGNIDGVLYINDSKATNDQAAAVALSAYDPVYWIAGGRPKDGGYKDCEKSLSHVRHTFLIGEAEKSMAQWLDTWKIPYTLCGTLDKAVEAAHTLAQAEKKNGAVVLLSPACASWDQFKNFEHRGEVFTKIVGSLIDDQSGKS